MTSVLIVDDSITQRTLLARQLTDAGFNVQTAAGGRSGLAGVHATRPDVVVLDLMMPDITGHEVLERVRADADIGDLPIIVLTQQDTGEEAARVLLSGADDFVRKPYEIEELIARILVVVNKAQVLNHLRSDNLALSLEARVDPLSGLPNRRAAEDELHRLLSVAQRRDRDLSVVLVDLDRFKAINDGEGHAAGDRVIEAVAQALTDALRTEDVAGRWGGDEFVALLPDTSGEVVSIVAERIRSEIAATCLVTASLGWATWRPGESALDVMGRADAALYAAKAAGRNTGRSA